jgi:hypothetical protein
MIRTRPELQVMPCARFFIGGAGAFVATLAGQGDSLTLFTLVPLRRAAVENAEGLQ